MLKILQYAATFALILSECNHFVIFMIYTGYCRKSSGGALEQIGGLEGCTNELAHQAGLPPSNLLSFRGYMLPVGLTLIY